MKTYWLEGREARPALTKVISPQLHPGTELEWERAADIRDSIAEHSASQFNNRDGSPNRPFHTSPLNAVSVVYGQDKISNGTNPQGQLVAQPIVMSPVEERRIYSPVTFQDVARRSIANSPNKIEKGRGESILKVLCNVVIVLFVS